MTHSRLALTSAALVALVLSAAGCEPKDAQERWPSAERRTTTAGWSAVDVATLPGMLEGDPIAAVEGRVLYGIRGTADGAHAFAYDLDSGAITDLGAAVEGGGVTVEGVSDGILYGQGSDGNGVIRPLLLDLATKHYTLVPHPSGQPMGPEETSQGIVKAADSDYAVGSWLDPETNTSAAFAYRIPDAVLIDLSALVAPGSASMTADGLEDGVVTGTVTAPDGSRSAYAYNLDQQTMTDLGSLPQDMTAPQPKVIRDGIVYGTGTLPDGSQATWSSPWDLARMELVPGGEGRLMTITDDGRYLLGTMIREGRDADPRPAWMIDLASGERIDLGVPLTDEPGRLSAFAFDGTSEFVLGRLIRFAADGGEIDTVLWQLPLEK